jgi:putative ribosome biogenesis GTPase RsgA
MISRFVRAGDLKSGDTIKLSPRHSKTKWIREVKPITEEKKRVPKAERDHIVLVFWSCHKMIMHPDSQVFQVHSPKAAEREVSRG